MPNRCILLVWGIVLWVRLNAQKDTTEISLPGSGRFTHSIQQKSTQLEKKLDRKTEQVLAVFLKKEQKLQRKLVRKDSAAAAELSISSSAAYASLQKQFASGEELQEYISSLDSSHSSLTFLPQRI